MSLIIEKNIMTIFSSLKFRNIKNIIIAAIFILFTSPSIAEDIDIFVGSSGGVAVAPKIMIMLDNSTNDLFAEKLNAISSVLNSINSTNPIDIGLAMWSPGSIKGAYVRFAPRDMSVLANRQALQNILKLIATKNEYNGIKDEPESFYEIYKYYSSLAPYAGVFAGTTPNPNADANLNNGSYTGGTAFGQGLSSGFAFAPGNTLYNSVATSCGKNYIIYIAANNGFTPQNVGGKQTYENLNAGPELPITATKGYWGDEWTHYLYGNSAPKIVTYVIDAASAGNSDAGYSAVLQSEAKQGGGTWQYASSQQQITTQLLQIFDEIQSVNSTFASASLPINTTNRSQNKNQIFIPVFRPDPDAKPRWMGNLKQYQLITYANSVTLGDSAGLPAINPLTGFVTGCANSFWTTDSGTYWNSVVETPSPAGNCSTTLFDKFSDAPDGSIVEKGGVAEVLRKGNNPPTTNTSPSWAVNRKIYTQALAGGALVTFNTTTTGLSQSSVNYVSGQDVNAEFTGRTAPSALTRPSIHGDVIHSRPLPIDYGGTVGVVAYYGANDGMFRAIDTSSGKEIWSFVAPENLSKFNRLQNNSPLISYPNLPTGIIPTPIPKDYFFDGTIGVYQNADNTKVWIYPTMRRGGRMIYGFDVTTPTAPAFKWKVGCPNSNNDVGCTSGMSGLGQTWSLPEVTSQLLGYSGAVVVVGGGYDGCEDADTSSPNCASPKGAGIHIIDADTGVIIKSFSTLRSVSADISLLAVANPGVVDYAYAADTGGNIYRINFNSNGPSSWTISRIAYTNGSGRKFFYPPALLLAPNKQVYMAVGSGDREHPLQSQYPYASVVNRFYVYRDDLATTNLTNLDDVTVMNSLSSDSSCTAANILPGSTKKGYFIDLNQYGLGEQTVTSAVIAGGLVAFSTNRPIPAATGTCATTLGEARGYWINLFNASGAVGVAGACGGARSGIFVGGGLPPSPSIGIVPINGKPTAVVIGTVDRTGAVSTSISPQELKPTINQNRKTIYWKSSGEN